MRKNYETPDILIEKFSQESVQTLEQLSGNGQWNDDIDPEAEY